VPFHLSLSERHAEELLISPTRNVQPFTILRNLEAIGSGSFGSGNFGPALAGVPFPESPIHFSSRHLGASACVTASQKIRSNETSVRKRKHFIQSNRIRRDRASDPRQGRWTGLRVELEYFNRLALAVIDNVKRMQ